LNGGQITTGSAGQFRADGTVKVLPAGTSTIVGNVLLESGVVITNYTNAKLFIYAGISGSYGMTMAGAGQVYLLSSNSYTGLTVVQPGEILCVEDAHALGGTTSGTVVSNGATLILAVPGNSGITNESLTLNGGPGVDSLWGALDVETGTNTWAGPITNNANSTLDAWEPAAALHIAGPISGAGGLELTGYGTHSFEGSTANTYAGTTTVDEDTTLLLGKPLTTKAVPGPLVIGSGATVRLLNSFQIFSASASVTMSDYSLLDLAGFEEWVGPISMQGAQIKSGFGTLYFSGDITVNRSTVAQSLISGDALIWNGTYTITNSGHNYSPDLLISANVGSGGGGGGGLIKAGAGEVSLAGDNYFTGPVTVNGGNLWAATSTAFGNTNTPATVNNGGSIFLNGNILIGLKPLVLNGNGYAFGALNSGYGSSSWSGTVNLASDSTISVMHASDSLTLSNVVGGAGSLTENGPGTLTFSGSTANTYAGLTTVSSGTLVLNKSVSVEAIPHNLDIFGTVRLAANHQIADSADVLVESTGLLDIGSSIGTFDTLRGNGSVTFGTGGYLNIGYDDGTSTFNGVMSGIGFVGGYTVGKYGMGAFTMNGNNTYQNGSYLFAGALIVNGNQPQSPVFTHPDTILGGSGVVGNINSSGSVSPGTSPGILTSSNLTFTSSGHFVVEMTGPTPGTDYDQLNVRGTNNLANAVLNINLAFTKPVAVGQQFTIINNDGTDPITGIFLGYPEGASFLQNGYAVAISYIGGTGNDVVLTLTALPGAVAGSTVTSGNGNTAIDPNECDALSIGITNTSGMAMTGVSATLSSADPNVMITQPASTYADVPSGGTSTNITPFQISVLSSFLCGNNINLNLTVTSASHGSFVMPVVLQTGETSATATRLNFTNLVSIPDIGSVESSNLVSGFSGRVMKVAVSLYLTHPSDQDLTNISLIGPDGTTVMLSAANGGSGQNYGSGTNDASRTTFDDAAATAITSGSAPFVGTFRPQSPLSAFIGSTNVNGYWRLHIADGYGGSSGTLRAWSLFLYPLACGSGGGACALCADGTIYTKTLDASGAMMAQIIGQDTVPSTCSSPKVCPGYMNSSRYYHAYPFYNARTNSCVTVVLTSFGSNLISSAFLGTVNTTNFTVCSTYLANCGLSTGGAGTVTYSFNAPSNSIFIVVVNNWIGGGGTYSLSVSGGNCTPALNIAPAGSAQVDVNWPTVAGGYKLEATPSLPASAWTVVTNEPIAISNLFNVTNSSVYPTNQFYRLHKP
jgi:autotransporter-associated beta strand protein